VLTTTASSGLLDTMTEPLSAVKRAVTIPPVSLGRSTRSRPDSRSQTRASPPSVDVTTNAPSGERRIHDVIGVRKRQRRRRRVDVPHERVVAADGSDERRARAVVGECEHAVETLRAETGLKLSDCCVLLAAEGAAATTIITFDDALARESAKLGMRNRLTRM
jgi:hypothetical protein